MCRLLAVSVSGYYAWVDRKPSNRTERNRDLTIKIKAIFDEELEGKDVPEKISKLIEDRYYNTQHKRELPKTPNKN